MVKKSTMSSAEKDNTSLRPILPFAIPTAILLIGLGVALLVTPKGALHLWLCQPHTAFLDTWMPRYSNLVDWIPYVSIVLLLFYRAGWSVFLAGNLLLTTAIVQPIKHWINAPRPLTWFGDNMPDVVLPLAEGVRMNYWLSFPSGHTATFFALFFTASLLLMDTDMKAKGLYAFLCFILATIGAYTRIYLSQHFALDIFGGIICAFISTLLFYYLYVPRTKNTHFWAWNVQKLRK